MLLVHKIEIKANNKQKTYFAKSCGIARFSYNWGLAKWQEMYAQGEKPNEAKIRKALNAIKAEQFPWMLEVTKVAPQQAIKNLGEAYKRFFSGNGKYPRFKKKGIYDSFRADNGPPQKGMSAVKVAGKKVQLPVIGWIRLKEAIRFKGQIKSVVISRKADRWFAAISIDTENLPHVHKSHGIVGVDLGINTFATLSNGNDNDGPRAHRRLLGKLQRLSKNLSRKQKGSRNRNKARVNLSRLHARIQNIRIDNLHKLTTHLALNHHKIGIEQLNVKGMIKNRRLSRHIMDQSFYEFRRQLEYKSKWYGCDIIVADQFFPSSKRCHACHQINSNLKLSDRRWLCECGAEHDRDLNAAMNLEQLARTVSSTGIHACGEGSSGLPVKH